MLQNTCVVIKGRVQGVAYRYWTRGEALARGLRGYVRNRRDGAVEAVFSGEAEAVDAMIEACWRGPPAARVSEVVVSPMAQHELGEAFSIEPTL